MGPLDQAYDTFLLHNLDITKSRVLKAPTITVL